MGLDGVELVMAVEETFGITIADEEAQNALTVGDLRRLVEGKLRLSDEETCLTQRAFGRLRRAFVNELKVPRRMFTPGESLEMMVPRENRPEIWHQLRVAVGAVEWPELSRPAWINSSIAVMTVGTLIITGFFLHAAGWNTLLCLTFAIAFAIAIADITWRMTASRKTEFNRLDVRQLAEFMVAKNPQLLGLKKDVWTAERIKITLRNIICDQIGVDENQVTDEARFVQDLGVD